MVNAGDIRDEGLIPGSGRSPGEGNGYPLQYSCLENPMDRGAWQATVHRVERVRQLKRLSICAIHSLGFVKLLVTQLCPTLRDPWTACKATLSTEFSRQKYWSG